MWRHAMVPVMIAAAALMGCQNNDITNSDTPFNPLDHPLHPVSVAEGANDTGEWAEQFAEVMRDVARVELQRNTDLIDDCIQIIGVPPASTSMTFGNCVEEGSVREGTVTMTPIINTAAASEYIMRMGDSGDTFAVTGHLNLVVNDGGMREMGSLNLDEQESAVELRFDFTLAPNQLADEDPYPIGTMTVDYEMLDRTDLHVVVTLDGSDVFDIVANGVRYSFDSETGGTTVVTS
ncbi:MAG: hypothetical protein ABI743_08645 [bacterium]